MIRDPLHVFVADFGKPLTLHFATGDVEVLGIHDEAYIDQVIGEVDMDTTAKRVVCVASDVSGVRRETEITMDGIRYSVTRKKPDGTGFVILCLTNESEAGTDEW